MNAVITQPEELAIVHGVQFPGANVHLELDILDVIALLQVIRAGVGRSRNLRGGLRTRILALHEFLLDQLPPRFRCRLLAGRFLR